MASKCINDTLENFVPFKVLWTADRLQDTAKRELGETPEVRERSLEKLRILIEDHNVKCITRDDFLLRFLRTKKFNVERSFEALCNYAHHRVALNDLLLKLQPEVVKTVLRHNILGVLPYRDAQGRIVVYYRTGIWNQEICSDEEMKISVFLLSNCMAQFACAQVNGVVVLIDNKCFNFANIGFLMRHIDFLKNFLLNCLPTRYTKIHVINEPPVIKYVVQLLQPFVPKKIQDRAVFHGKSRELLFQHMAAGILPDDFDGTCGPLTNDPIFEVLDEYLQKVKEEQSYFLEQNC